MVRKIFLRSTCPECGEVIGGANHSLETGNSVTVGIAAAGANVARPGSFDPLVPLLLHAKQMRPAAACKADAAGCCGVCRKLNRVFTTTVTVKRASITQTKVSIA